MDTDTSRNIPLVCDLDGTLLEADTTWLLFLKGLGALDASLPLRLAKGRTAFKDYLSSRYHLSLERLPWNDAVVSMVRQAQAEGREAWLVSASNEALVGRIARHFGFDGHAGSSATHNLKAENKVAWLVERFGEEGFDYAGDSESDLRVWPHARIAWVSSSFRKTQALSPFAEKVRRFEGRMTFPLFPLLERE